MIAIKTFTCGLCKSGKEYTGTRKGLRLHLKKEHRIIKEITNRESISTGKKEKQRWWKEK